MPEESVETLRIAHDASRTEVAAIRKKVEQAEVWLKALAVVAFVFGIAGGFGWTALNSAREKLSALEVDVTKSAGSLELKKQELTDFTALRRRDISAEADRAIEAAVQRSNAMTRLSQAETRIALIGSADAPASSGQPIGQIRTNMVATCPAGHVARAVKPNLGGTCNNNCNGDGQPVSQLELTCVRQ